MYGKHFSSMYEGSMMGAGPVVFAVWGYVIAKAVDGQVELNPRLISVLLGTEPENVQSAIHYLCLEDPNSRSKKNDGRRLVKVGQFSYEVTTHEDYRNMRSEDDRRQYNRDKKRQERERKQSVKNVNDMSMTVKNVKNVNDMSTMSKMSAHTEAEAEAEAHTESESKINKEKKREENPPPAWDVPENLDSDEVRELLQRFAAMRVRIKKRIKDFASASVVLKHFDSPEHLIYALETCIANEYQGLKPDYRPKNSNGKSKGIAW